MNHFILRNDPAPPNRPNRLTRLAQTAGLLLALSLVAGFAAWLLWLTGCLYDARLSPLCGHPSGAWVVFLGAIALTWLWVAWWLRERLGRRLRRGMYARRVAPLPLHWGGLGYTLYKVAMLAWEGEWPDAERDDGSAWVRGRQHPAIYHNQRGWWVEVAIDGGRRVWVGQQAMYEWFVRVCGREIGPGESAIGQRYWEPVIGRGQWDARCKLLEAVGAAARGTDSPNSRQLARRDVLGVMEDLEDRVPLQENRPHFWRQ